MFDDANLTELEERGFIGAVVCAPNGSIIDATSDDMDIFGGVLGFISQVADMIGEPFGTDTIEEIHLACEGTTAICIPQQEDGCLGVLCSSRSNTEEILNELLP